MELESTAQDTAERRPGPNSDGFHRGDEVDRFVVLGELGRGGMGVVLSAYDPDLDRKVAIKLLPADASEAASSRLFREAQAMARLSHPNVATIYEVGIALDRVFIAMEQVEGETLRDWLAAADREHRAIVDVFVQAGRGLAAAHRAGLIHRDFKPGNVMVGDDGRVRVLDFGLARAAVSQAEDDELSDIRSDEVSPLGKPLTRAGAIIGTPAYMAPEQYLGQAVDARTDQFSFCVALYEALFRQRPFSGETIAELSDEVVEGRVREPPGGVNAPAHLERLLTRGLSRMRRDRYPSMTELLEDLSFDPAIRRRRWVGVGALVAVAGLALVGALSMRSDRGAQCDGARDRVARMWSEPQKTALASSFAASKRAHAAATATAVTRSIDDYLQRWSAMHADSCKATHQRREQSSELLDLRAACLDRQLAQVSALIDVLTRTKSAEVVDRALETANRLPNLGYCADAAALKAVVPPPQDPAVRARVKRVRERIANIQGQIDAGDYEAARPRAKQVVEDAKQLDYAPVQVEALLALAALQDVFNEKEVEATLREVARAGSSARHDAVVAKAWVKLIGIISDEARFDDAIALVPVAEGWLARARANAATRARFYDVVGLAYSRAGRYKKSRVFHQRGLTIARAELTPQNVDYRAILNNLGLIEWRLGNHAAALALHNERLAIQRRVLGENHPHLGHTYTNIGLVLRSMGKRKEAVANIRKALEQYTRTYGRMHERVGTSLYNLAESEMQLARYDQALKLARESYDVLSKSMGADHPKTIRSVEAMASAYWMKGKLAEAETWQRKTVRLREKVLPANHPRLAQGYNNMAGILGTQGKFAEALVFFRRALAIREKRLPPTHPLIGGTLTDIGTTLFHLKRPAEAVPLLERALVIRRKAKIAPMFVAFTELELARNLWVARPEQRKRAMELALQARKRLRKASKYAANELAEVEAWLKKRGR